MYTSPSPRAAAFGAGLLVALAGRTGTASAPAVPAPVAIPATLRAHVPQLEMSGLVWSTTLERYLVVIDDTIDTQEGTRRAPFVLALDQDGRVDAAPVPIVGVPAIDDAESITAGPDDTFFLLTSHSPSRRGKVRDSRSQLLALKLANRTLKVTGALDLLVGHHDLVDTLEHLGFPVNITVDLEAVNYHDGALYIGCKSPLLPDGSAMILRLDHPEEAFARGKVPKHRLSLWAQVKLTVPSAAGPLVPQGIADLFFARDGALYLCANSPKGGEKDGGGALWRIADPRGGQLEAHLVHRFVKLKPEGVTAAPDGRTLTLVFDRGLRDPLWMRWSLER